MEKHVDGASIVLADFIKRSVPLCIPLFQRNYSWKVVNVERLLKDEWQDYKQTRTTFLGSIVTQQDKGSDCNIIDGQQRLTTINLILLALREMFRLGKSPKDVEFYDKLLLTAGQSNNSRASGESKPCLRMGAQEESLFRELVLSEGLLPLVTQSVDGMNNGERRLLMALECCLEHFASHALKSIPALDAKVKQQSIGKQFHAYRCLANFCQRSSFDEGIVLAYDGVLTQLSKFWQNMAEKTYLIWVQTKDLEWAFRVFHSLNDTGVPLKDIDKLKAHMLNNWSSHGDAQLNHAKTWNNCIKMVEEEDAFDQVVRYIAIGAGMDLRDNLLVFMEEQYTEKVSGMERKVYGDRAAASQYMIKLESICRLYRAINMQDADCMPQSLKSGHILYKASTATTLEQEREASRLLQMLHLLVTDSKSNAHMLAAVWFLHGFCHSSSKLAVEPEDVLKFLRALERRAAFYLITSSGDTKQSAGAESPGSIFVRYREIAKDVRAARATVNDLTKRLVLSAAEEQQFASQLSSVCRRPLENGTLPKATAMRIVQFLVKRHELDVNKELHSLPDHTVEHILPRNPKKGAWASWSADERNQLLWSLGNLTLLTGPTNAKLQNADFPIKVEKLQERAISFVTAQKVYTGSTGAEVRFHPGDCDERGEAMLRQLYELYRLPEQRQPIPQASAAQVDLTNDVDGGNNDEFEELNQGAGPSQRHGIPHDSFADEGLSQPAKKRKVSEEGFASKKVRIQDFYVKVNRSQTKRDHLEWTAEEVTAHLRAQYNQLSNTEKEEWRERAIQDML